MALVDAARVSMLIRDDRIAIVRENLIKFFGRGFITRKNGNAFLLHAGAGTAKKLALNPMAHRDGSGQVAGLVQEWPTAGHRQLSDDFAETPIL